MKAAVICAQGIGDGLMMMVAAHLLHEEGYQVTVYQNALHQLSPFFPHFQFEKHTTLTDVEKALSPYAFLVLQNDNSSLSFEIIDLHKEGKLPKHSVLYSSYSPNKHRPLTSFDRIFDRSVPMVTNIGKAMSSVLNRPFSTQNGLIIPLKLSPKKHSKRVLIHPTSTTPKRTWSASGFLAVAKGLKKAGFIPAFCVSPSERDEWLALTQGEFEVPEFATLSDLASYVYESRFLIGNESGTGHLASNLGLPTLIVASCRKQMALWRPGWHPGKVLTPSRLIPNFKSFRLREKKWQTFISPKCVLKTFFSMINEEAST